MENILDSKKDATVWDFVIDTNLSPSKNVQKLLDNISFNKIKFITTESCFDENSMDDTYLVSDVTMMGDVGYVKSKLKESYAKLVEYLEDYSQSEESVWNRIRELSASRLYIKEYTLKNNLFNPVLLEIDFLVTLISFNDMRSIFVRYEQCKLTSDATSIIHKHQEIRMTYVDVLDNNLSIFIDKINLSLYEQPTNVFKPNPTKEIELLEVWIGLKEAGFINFLKNNPTNLAEHRKYFFDLFELTDKHYNSRNRIIKQRCQPTGTFLLKLSKLLENYHKK